MENFELLRNVTIGQYLPTGSAIHRLDPRAKIVAGLILLLAFALFVVLFPWPALHDLLARQGLGVL